MDQIEITITGIPRLTESRFITIEIPPNSSDTMTVNVDYDDLQVEQIEEESSMEQASPDNQQLSQQLGQQSMSLSGQQINKQPTKLSERQIDILSLATGPNLQGSNQGTTTTNNQKPSVNQNMNSDLITTKPVFYFPPGMNNQKFSGQML